MSGNFAWSRAALAGFAVLRREPGVLVIWGLVGLVFGLADQVIAVNAEIFRITRSGSFVAPLIGSLRLVVGAVAMAIFSAAVYRAVLRPDGETRARMRFGADEIRLTWFWLLQGLLLVIVTILIGLPVFLIADRASQLDNPYTTIAAAVGLGGGLIVWGVLLVRLSLAAPMVVAQGRWSVRDAWRSTRGRAWKIAGVYVPLLIASALFFSLWTTLCDLAAYAMHVKAPVHASYKGVALADLFTSTQLFFTALDTLVGAAAAAMLYAPAAVIYRDLKGLTPDDQASVFD